MTNPQVDWFFAKQGRWQEAFQELRYLVLESGLTEELKWGCPCYRAQKNNIVLIHGFKGYCALLFMQGALLSDPQKLLVQQTKQVQAARQMRFTSVEEILENKSTLLAYLQEAIQNDHQGLKVTLKATTEFEIPAEFQSALTEMPELKTAFDQLTPGRQRAYLLYFSAAKQSKTRLDRVEKYIPKILNLKGLDD